MVSRGEHPRPIGVFDSGVGGLTVARAILEDLPNEPLLPRGQRAVPYGPSPSRNRRFGLSSASFLVSRDVKMLVSACNTIEVPAIEDIGWAAGIPVVGVVNPGVRAAVRVPATAGWG